MPLGAFRLNSLARYISAAVSGRTAVAVTAYGNAQIDTAQSKFGGASALFDGNADWLEINSIDTPAFGTGDFTLEFWLNLNVLPYTNGYMYWDQRPGSNGNYPLLFTDNNNSTNLRYFINGADRIVAPNGTLSVGSWKHIAVVRSSGTTKMYVEGTQVGADYADGTDYQAGRLRLGANMNGVNSTNGWMDEMRMSNTARYTANFTPSTTPFTNDDNTLLLLHMDGTDGSTNFIDDNSSIGSAVELSGVSIANNAYLQASSITNNMSSTSRAGTISLWYKNGATNTGTRRIWIGRTASNTYLSGPSIWLSATGKLTFYGYFGANNGWIMQQDSADGLITGDGWHNIVFSYDRATSQSNARLYVDGISRSLSNTRYTNSTDGMDTLGLRQINRYVTTTGEGFSIAQVWADDTFISLDDNIDKFYHPTGGPVDMGSDGTASGLPQPYAYHYGNTSTFYSNSGRTSGSTYMTYTLSVTGSISDTTTGS